MKTSFLFSSPADINTVSTPCSAEDPINDLPSTALHLHSDSTVDTDHVTLIAHSPL